MAFSLTGAWVPVDECLPDEGEPVLCTLRPDAENPDPFVHPCVRTFGDWFSSVTRLPVEPVSWVYYPDPDFV